jgi:cytosine/uracil/thiamine/allantoin permease
MAIFPPDYQTINFNDYSQRAKSKYAQRIFLNFPLGMCFPGGVICSAQKTVRHALGSLVCAPSRLVGNWTGTKYISEDNV